MNNLLIQKQEIEEDIVVVTKLITLDEKEISRLESELERIKELKDTNEVDLSNLETRLADIDLEIEEWTEDNEQDLNEDIRNQSNPNEN